MGNNEEKTKVFISWSGELGKNIGQEISCWLPKVLHYVTTFFSPNMDKGKLWISNLFNELEKSEIGLICLTEDSLDSPWLLFETGAIAKKIFTPNNQIHVCTLLFLMKPSDLKSPLSDFQYTQFNSEDYYKLIETINSTTKNPLDSSSLKEIFNVWWPYLENKIKQHLIQKPQKLVPKREPNEILDEVLARTKRIEDVLTAGLSSKKADCDFCFQQITSTVAKEVNTYDPVRFFRKYYSYLSELSPTEQKKAVSSLTKERENLILTLDMKISESKKERIWKRICEIEKLLNNYCVSDEKVIIEE